MWGISYANLQMLVVDSMSTFYNSTGSKNKTNKNTGEGTKSKQMNFGEFLSAMHKIQKD